MNQKISDFKDEIGEKFVEAGKAVMKQVNSKPVEQAKQDDKKVDPTTGKPVPSKKMLRQLNQQVAQLAQIRLKKVREELEKQRLKTASPAFAKASTGEAGPEIKVEDKKPKDDAVQKTLQASKSTGEFKGAIGG